MYLEIKIEVHLEQKLTLVLQDRKVQPKRRNDRNGQARELRKVD